MKQKGKVKYQYRCRRCRDVFSVGEPIDALTAEESLAAVAADYDTMPTSVIHVCRDRGRGFADVVGITSSSRGFASWLISHS